MALYGQDELIKQGYTPEGGPRNQINPDGTISVRPTGRLNRMAQVLGDILQVEMEKENKRQEKLKKQFDMYKVLRDAGYDAKSAHEAVQKNQFPDAPGGESLDDEKKRSEIMKNQAQAASAQALAANRQTAGSQLPQGFVRAGGKVYKDPNYVSPQAEMKKLDVKELSEMQKTLPKLDQASKALGQLETLFYEGFQPTQDPVKARTVQGISAAVSSRAGFNPKGQAYLNNRKAFAGLIAKGGFGEAGMLTDQDIKRVTNALPNEFSTAEEAKTAFGEIKKILSSARKSYEQKRGQVFGGDDIPTFNSEEEADAADLPSGTIVRIGNKKARIN